MLLHESFSLAIPALYMDPGTGSMLIQLILAALLGIGIGIRLFWSRIRGIFGATSPSKLEDDEDGDDE